MSCSEFPAHVGSGQLDFFVPVFRIMTLIYLNLPSHNSAVRCTCLTSLRTVDLSRMKLYMHNTYLINVQFQPNIQILWLCYLSLQMLAKFAEDDRIEQMNAQKRRMKQLEHKRAVEQLLEDRRAQYAAERVWNSKLFASRNTCPWIIYEKSKNSSITRLRLAQPV